MNVRKTLSSDVTASPNKRMMVFVLVLSLSGLENTIAEFIPEPTIGPIELGVSSFIFLPLAIVFLFPYIEAALAVPLGEIVFTEFLLGEFSGLGELSEVLLITAFVYVAAQMLKDPLNPKQVFLAAAFAKIGSQIPATLLDIGLILVGAEDFEAVSGLPSSIVVIEVVDMIPEAIITGLILGAVPAAYLVPQLYGKIEPLLGIDPRPRSDEGLLAGITAVHWLALVAVSIVAFFVASAGYFFGLVFFPSEETGVNLADLLGVSGGESGLLVSLAVAVIIVFVAIVWGRVSGDESA